MDRYLVDIFCECGELLTDGIYPGDEVIAPKCHSCENLPIATDDLVCVCGQLLTEGIVPGEALIAPECPICEKKSEEPSVEVLLAVYGAPGNWPVEPGIAAT